MIGISRCLLGYKCRYNATHAKCNILVKNIKNKNNIFHLCPEQEGLLSTPRNPSEIISLNPIKIIDSNGRDVSNNFIDGTLKTIDIIKRNKTKKLILKSKSPSCGVNEIYDGSFSGKIIKGHGLLKYFINIYKIDIEIIDDIEYSKNPFFI